MIDLLIAGGGPVGLVTALYARRAGLTAAIVEPREGAIDKACGEGVMPEALARLADLGVDPPGRDFCGIRYIAGTRSAEARFSSGNGRGVRRTTLHAALRDRADELGIERIHDRVSGIEERDEHVEAAGVAARYLIGADGLHSVVRNVSGLAAHARGSQRYGVRQHFTVKPWTDLVEVHWLPHAEVYITPVSDAEVGFAVLGRRPVSLRNAISALPAIAERIGAAEPASAERGAEPASAERGAGPMRQATSARTSGRVLLVGDAAGYVDALTGEGLRMGFAEAAAAVDAVVRDDPASYEAEWLDITKSYRRLTNTLLWVSARAPLRPMIVPAARRFPGLFRRGVESIGG